MKLKKSLISVIMPVYNNGKFLTQCMESLTRQSCNNLEIIVVDDKSKDNSLNILKSFKNKFKKTSPGQSRKIQILQNKKHYGPAICLNRALKIANGQYIALMNPYDYISLNKFEKQAHYLNSNAKTVVVGSQYVTIGKNNKKLTHSDLPQQHEEIYHGLLHSLPMKPETVMINRMLLPKDLLYFTSNKYPLIYTEVLIKLLQYGKIANLDQALYFHREGIRRIRRPGKIKQIFALIKLLLKSRSIYDYRPDFPSSIPALKSLFNLRYE